jgi:hypothetical protein
MDASGWYGDRCLLIILQNVAARRKTTTNVNLSDFLAVYGRKSILNQPTPPLLPRWGLWVARFSPSPILGEAGGGKVNNLLIDKIRPICFIAAYIQSNYL